MRGASFFPSLQPARGCYCENTVKISTKQKHMEETHTSNRLMLYRKRMKLTQKEVAAILGLRTPGVLSHYERGTSRPSLERALALEIVYRVPVAFLFPNLYEDIRARIRDKESQLKPLNQPTLL